MNNLYKIFIFGCFIFSIVGIIIIIGLVGHEDLPFHYGIIINIIGFLFWYLQPILGLILIFAPKKRGIKYLGAFFFVLWLIAFLSYIFRP